MFYPKQRSVIIFYPKNVSMRNFYVINLAIQIYVLVMIVLVASPTEAADIGTPFQLAGPKVAANPQDKWVLPMDNRILVITQDGRVFVHKMFEASIDVVTEKHQLGGFVNISGHGFTPGDSVRVFFDGIAGLTAPTAGGFANVAADGSFSGFVFDARCAAVQPSPSVTVRVTDHHGRSATGTTSAFDCR